MDVSKEENVIPVRKSAGMVFQNPDNQLVATVVEEDVAFGPENLGLAREEIRRRVDEALAVVNMTEYAGHAPHKLSGGQKQRVSIARALLKNAPVLIFDDSTSALDVETERRLLQTIRTEYADRTVIITAHRLSSVVDCDEIIYMRDGRVTERGTFDELMALNGDFAQVYNIQQAQRQSVMDYDSLATKSGVN